jgi:four helix bundle protein
MNLIARDVILQAVHASAPLLPLIRKHDRDLHDQVRRALQSAALNVGESAYSDDGNRRARLFTAAGSANEARCALQLAVAFGYVSAKEAAEADALLDRSLALLWRLTRGRRK